jgi:hypothetical protein
MTVRLLVVLARHGSVRYPDAIERVRRRVGRSFPGTSVHTLVVDNAEVLGTHEQVDSSTEIIGGSNHAWEFSAWDEGLAHLEPALMDFDGVVLCTSAFEELYSSYLDRFSNHTLEFVRRRSVVVGHLDYYNQPVVVAGSVNQSWLRTSFVLLAPRQLRRLGALTSTIEASRLFSGDHRAPFAADAPVSSGFQRNVLTWLTGDGTGQGVEWHSRFELDGPSLERFERKCAAIVNEQLLTCRLRALGCQPVDVTWFAGRVPAGTLDVVVPAWQVQVVGRTVDAGPESLLEPPVVE